MRSSDIYILLGYLTQIFDEVVSGDLTISDARSVILYYLSRHRKHSVNPQASTNKVFPEDRQHLEVSERYYDTDDKTRAWGINLLFRPENKTFKLVHGIIGSKVESSGGENLPRTFTRSDSRKKAPIPPVPPTSKTVQLTPQQLTQQINYLQRLLQQQMNGGMQGNAPSGSQPNINVNPNILGQMNPNMNMNGISGMQQNMNMNMNAMNSNMSGMSGMNTMQQRMNQVTSQLNQMQPQYANPAMQQGLPGQHDVLELNLGQQ